MRRRAFIAGLGGAAVLPLAARAQQPEPVRRIGVLAASSTNDPEGQRILARCARRRGDRMKRKRSP
jgi:putative tryptophan/tyrosine transport system substrate-binding protein